ncbi:MAG: HIT domain-containing protein [Alphaproteobacteria bacterium]
MSYDNENIFAKILRGEIPNNTIYEDEHNLAFYDITPARKVHGLIIPKGAFKDYTDFVENATPEQMVSFNKAVVKTAEKLGIKDTGYRIISNIGEHGQQEVPHLHFHILGGEKIGSLVSK